ncbi:MAG: vitamin K epoxide reductase family protein [bacterium]|nr:vitamin K epoxide reductase family protein [bacterium]
MSIFSRRIIWAMVAVAFLGFLDAVFLTIEHYTNNIPPCFALTGCEQVTTSVYATVAGIPVALAGAAYYFLILVVGLLYLDLRNAKLLTAMSYLPIVGLLASIYFVSLQLFVIKALCLYCVVSAMTSTTLFILGLIVLQLRKKEVSHE